eukprot:4958323-Pyramimonas_sp.AAC.1
MGGPLGPPAHHYGRPGLRAGLLWGGHRPWVGPPAPAAASAAAAPLQTGILGHRGSLGEAADAMLAVDVAGGLPAEAPAWRCAAHHLGQPLDSGLVEAAPPYCCCLGVQDRP